MVETWESSAYAAWISALRDRAVKIRIDIRIRCLFLSKSRSVRLEIDRVWELRIHYGLACLICITKDGEAGVIFPAGEGKRTQKKRYSRYRRACSHSLGKSNDQGCHDHMGSSCNLTSAGDVAAYLEAVLQDGDAQRVCPPLIYVILKSNSPRSAYTLRILWQA